MENGSFIGVDYFEHLLAEKDAVLKNSRYFTDIFQAFHESLVLTGYPYVILCLKANQRFSIHP